MEKIDTDYKQRTWKMLAKLFEMRKLSEGRFPGAQGLVPSHFIKSAVFIRGRKPESATERCSGSF